MVLTGAQDIHPAVR